MKGEPMGNWTIQDHVLGPKYKCYMCFDEGLYWAKPEHLIPTLCKCALESFKETLSEGLKKMVDRNYYS